VRGLHPSGQQGFVVLGANEVRVAVLFQQQVVHVLAGAVEGEARRRFQLRLSFFHCLAVNVDLARRTRRQELAARAKKQKHECAVSTLGREQKLHKRRAHLRVDLFDFGLDL
jgi:hypothetical protein